MGVQVRMQVKPEQTNHANRTTGHSGRNLLNLQ